MELDLDIVHTIPRISNEASGPSYSVVRLCQSLIDNGQSVKLAGIDSGDIKEALTFFESFPLGIGPQRIGRSPKMKKWLRERAISNKISLLHNHSLWMMPNVYPGQISRDYDIPLVVSPRGTLSEWAMQHGSKVKRLFWPGFQKPVLKQAYCFHATAFSEYEDIRRHGFKQPVAIIPNGIDLPTQRDQYIHNEKKLRTLLFLGRIHPIKGIDILLNSWSIVFKQFPDWQLHIAGPDNDGYINEMKLLSSKLNLERIKFLGPFFGADKIKKYQDADLFVLPTYSENFGMTVAESLAAGTPTIVSKGAPWEELDSRAAGWWIDVGVEPLVACLREALSSSHDTLNSMGDNGREWMAKEYSWDNIAKKLVQTYRWIQSNGDKPECVIEN